MECKESIETSAISAENATPKTFIFSSPSLVSYPKIINSGFDFEQTADAPVDKKNVFTFAMPTSISEPMDQDAPDLRSSMSEKQYKPKISRNSYKPAVNVFSQALKDTAMFEQLKKNSRMQVAKINPDNSITCANVPQSLLTKTAAKEYFTQFGNLLKITIRPKKQIIIVVYASKEEADIAYNEGGEYLGEKFEIEWTKLSGSPKSPTKKKCLQKNILRQMVTKFFKPTEDEVKSELDAMMNLEYKTHDRTNFNETIVKKNKTQPKNTSKSAMRAEKTSVIGEKHKSDSQISDLLPNATMEELQNIIQQPAYSSEDKYKVLEARDRLMRMKQVKSHILSSAKVMTGTCPDMCPEKERLMRESKRQVALYEQLDTNEYRINHSIAVKQYSRSSADQEEPMAHDLRPVKSLKMTMSYLLHEISNLCDQPSTNLGEWYHFLWDRTRGIRKDITQQELCCTDSVELVEQCARFHIVCSERLCAEEASVFDKKINSDNLTKCLQSLKYMYHDLRVKGINCKNEPKFRAYIILLNLNNGNFMWDLQKLPKNIQKSPEVQFALETYAALESNNYYKFFKLVQVTTYLNACILLRYFNQVRLKALSVLVKAYCRTASTAYPLYELIDILGFEDENEVIYFCEQVGLNVSKDGLYVLLNRQNFTMPVLNIKQGRACNLIEAKRKRKFVSIGECIAGEMMPEKTYKYHKPHNSFDSHGYLLPDSINAEDQNKNNFLMPTDPYEFTDEDIKSTENFAVTSEPIQCDTDNVDKPELPGKIKTTSMVESDKNVFSTTKLDTNVSLNQKPETQINKFLSNKNTGVKLKAENLNDFRTCTTVAKQSSNEVSNSSRGCTSTPITSKTSNIFSKQFVSQPKTTASSFAGPNSSIIFAGTSQENIFSKNITSSKTFPLVHSNEQTVSKTSNVASPATIISKDTLKEKPNLHVLTAKVKGQEFCKEANEKLKLEEQESCKKIEHIDKTAEVIFDTLHTEVLQSYCSAIVKEELDRIQACNVLSEKLSTEIFNEVTYDICENILKDEINQMNKLHEMSLRSKNRVIIKYFKIWKFNVSRRKQQRIALESTPVWLHKHSSEQYAKMLYSERQDLVIGNMIKKQTKQKDIKPYYEFLAPIEVIIYLGIKDNLKNSNKNLYSNHYWKLVVSWPHLHNKPVLWHHKKIINQYLCCNDYTINPIIKRYQPNQIETLHICIKHFEGLISDQDLVGSDALLFIADASEELKSVIKRLTKTVLSRDRLMPIPVVFIILGNSTYQVEEKLTPSLEELLQAGYLSIYTIMHEKDLTEKTILNLTQSSILWLSINKSQQSPLEMDYLHNIYGSYLTDELWLRIFEDSLYNEKLESALEEPNFIINLHNEAITRLMDIILDPESFMYTKFAPELKKFVKSEHMMPCTYEYFDDIWKNEDYKAKVEEVMFSFKLPKWKYTWPITDNDILLQNITSYCQEALITSDNDQVSCNILSSLFLTSGVATISNFVNILLYIIKKKVYLLDTDLKVIYNKDYIKDFRTLPWWMKSDLLIKYEIVPKKINILKEKNENKHDTTEPMVKKRKVYQFEENDFEVEPLAAFCENTRSQVMEVNCFAKRVENSLKERQKQSLLLEEKLKDALLNEVGFS